MNNGVNTKLSSQSLTNLVINANNYARITQECADSIRSICKKMETDETLSGGDGDDIRKSFADIAVVCEHLQESVKHISTVLDEKLSKVIKATKGNTAGLSEAQASVNKDKQTVGTYKKE